VAREHRDFEQLERRYQDRLNVYEAFLAEASNFDKELENPGDDGTDFIRIGGALTAAFGRVELLARPAAERAASDLMDTLVQKMFPPAKADARVLFKDVSDARKRFVAAARADLGASPPTA
jgi:hypothetical protein